MDYETKVILSVASIGAIILFIIFTIVVNSLPRKSTEDIVKIARCRDYYECEDIAD